MKIDGIKNGLVLDHITAGKGMEIYRYLRLDRLDCCVALMMNVRSTKMGKKDMIKLDADIDLDLDGLGYIDPSLTVNVIKDGKLIEKKHLSLPARLENVLVCKNPRCITSIEQEIDQIFELADPEKGLYRCFYCDTAHTGTEPEDEV